MSRFRAGFTLVEILIVVVILGVLAAIVVPKMGGAAESASIAVSKTELNKLRRAVEVFQVSNDNILPTVVAGDGTWGEIVTPAYLRKAPMNKYIGGANSKVIAIGNAPDVAYQTTHGWIYDDATGQVWAGGFDANDEPLPRP